ncbi:MAG TPA: MATE family efflux transporter [Candidatus Atribacteria bacterium]|nr:MATE family efflux transporter [Candidatus Atribacteria bacterium]
MDHSAQLRDTKITTLLWRFSIPAIVGMLVNALYNVVDRIFVGQGVGSLGIAGIAVSYPYMMLMMSFGMLVGLGSTALVSIRLGERKKDEAEQVLGNALILLIVVSISLTFFGLILLRPILIISGASETTLPYAMDYLRIILIGGIFMGIGFGLNNLIRAEGNPRIAMATMLVGAITNVILDPIFIFGFGWGIQGAAIATILSQLVSAIWVVRYFLIGKSTLRFHFKYLKLKIQIVKRIFTIGIAPFVLQMGATLLFVILNNSLLIYGGDTAISVMGIIHSINMLLLMPLFGINHGAQPIVGYNYGAQQFDRVKETVKIASLAATGVVIVGFVLIMAFPQGFIMLFNKTDQELISMGVKALRIIQLMLPVVGFQVVGSGYFFAVGKAKEAMFLSLSRQMLILIPLVIILPRFMGLIGIFVSIPISDGLSFILTAILLNIEFKKLDQQHKERYEEVNREAS